MPHTSRPKLNLSVTCRGRTGLEASVASATRPNAFGPFSLTGLPLPRQAAEVSVTTVTESVTKLWPGASGLLSASTRSPVVAGAAPAAAGAPNTASAHSAGTARRTVVAEICMEHPFLEGRFATAGGRSPGLRARGLRLPGTPAASQWLTRVVQPLLHPVTVAGPRRVHTGLPSTTGRYGRPKHNPPGNGLPVTALAQPCHERRQQGERERQEAGGHEQRGGVSPDQLHQVDPRNCEHRTGDHDQRAQGGHRHEARARDRLGGAANAGRH